MRFRFFHIVAALTFFSVVGPQAHAVDIYVLSGARNATINGTTGFGKIDSATGVYTEISSAVSAGNNVGNLAWNAANSAFYVTENLGADQNLRTLSASGTLSSPIGTIGTSIYGMVYRPADSTLYSYDFTNNRTGTIDQSNGSWSVLNSSSSFVARYPVGGRYALFNNNIYASVFVNAVGGQFGTIGISATSTFSQIGSTDPWYRDMVLASDNTTIYGFFGDGDTGTQRLFTINPTDGTLSSPMTITGAGLGTYFYGAGFVTAVPEPSTYALAMIATGVMAFVARRRKGRKA